MTEFWPEYCYTEYRDTYLFQVSDLVDFSDRSFLTITTTFVLKKRKGKKKKRKTRKDRAKFFYPFQGWSLVLFVCFFKIDLDMDSSSSTYGRINVTITAAV